MLVKISELDRHYPNGYSLTTYQRIGRLIREHGTLVKVNIRPGSFESLRRALDRLEKQ